MNVKIQNNAQSILKMNAIFFERFEYKHTGFKTGESNLNVGFSVVDSIKDDFMEIKIGFEICGEELFILNGELVGQFTVTEKQDIGLNQLKTNAIAIMFPFLRSQITLLTSQPSLVPIVLPPININKVLESQMR